MSQGQGQLPIRLQTQPIIDAICEVRFLSENDASLILPGLLLKKFGHGKIEKLPASEVPEFVRQNDPKLRHQPLVRIVFNEYHLVVGSSNIAVACTLPYFGWANFKKIILDAIDVLKESDLISNIQRYSIKYTDLIELTKPSDALKYINFSVNIGDNSAADGPFKFGIQVQDGAIMHIIEVGIPAQVQIIDGRVLEGALISTDSLMQELNISLNDFSNNANQLLDELHLENKKKFFSCLTEEALDYLGAEYGNV